MTERLKTCAPRTSQRHLSLHLTIAGILCFRVALMPSPCSPTGWRPSDQCHCRELRYKKKNVSTLRSHKLSSFLDFTVKVSKYILCVSQLCYALLRTLEVGVLISVHFLQYCASDCAMHHWQKERLLFLPGSDLLHVLMLQLWQTEPD